MSLSDCSQCWDTPCTCGSEYKDYTLKEKEKLTKAINGFNIKDIFKWLADNNYIDNDKYVYKKMINYFKRKIK